MPDNLLANAKQSVGECQTIFWRPPDNLLVTAKRLRDICQAMCRTEFAHVMNGG